MTPEQGCTPDSTSRLIGPAAADFHRLGVRSWAKWLRLRAPSESLRLTLRSYRAGDDARVVALWNHSYAHYAGLATRTIEYWRWAVLGRPAMSEEDILLVESAQCLLGYAAVWAGGKVLELAVDPHLPRAMRRVITQQLLSELEARAQARQWDSLELMLPGCDRLIDRTLRSAGYAVEDRLATIVRLLNPAALLRSVTAVRAPRLTPLRGWRLLITLSAGDDPFLLQHRLYVRFGDSIEVRSVGDGDHPHADAKLQLTLAALAELVFCGASARDLLEAGELRIEPRASEAKVLGFLGALALETPWYTTGSDTF